MDKKKFIKLLTKQLSNEATFEEKKQLETLLKNDEYKDLYDWVLNEWNNKNSNPNFNLERGLDKLKNKITIYEPSFSWENKTTPKFSHHKNILKIAASIILFATVLFYLVNFFNNTPQQRYTLNEKSTHAGQKSILTLFDGTKIVLNANSKLKYPTRFGKTSRDVYLEGEAYFEVVHNLEKPFIVHTNRISTLVLGTKFNVSAFPDEEDISISLVEGKVSVFNKTENENVSQVQLKPHQQFVYNKKEHEEKVRRFNIVKVVGWKDNSFVFENEPLTKVFKKLERAFGVEFDIILKNNRKDYRIKANIKNESFWGVVETIKYTTGLDYKVVNNNNEIEKVIFLEREK